MDTGSIIILIPVLVIPWLILIFFLLNSKKRVVKNYKKLSEKYGLDCDLKKKSGQVFASGSYRNRNVRIETMEMDSIDGQKSVPHTLLSVECSNPDGFSFTVVKRKKQNIRTFQAASTLLDDNDFDGKFIVHTNNPVKMKQIFDFNTRFKMDQVHALGFDGMLTLQANNMRYAEKEPLKSDDSLMRFELVMHEFCDIADIMKFN